MGPIQVLGLPIKLSRTPGAVRTAAPTVGEHTAEILDELGYTPEEIQALRAGAIVA